MRIAIAAIGLILLALFGCASDTSSLVMECAAPLIQKGDGCCLDADSNGVCDVDEKKEEAKPPVTENKTEPAAENKSEEKAEEKEPAPAVEVKGTQEGAEKAAKTFAERWQLKQYNTMYVLFTDTLKEQKTATEFSAIMELDPFYKKVNKVEVKGVSLTGDNNADLKLMVHTNIQTIELPAAYLEFEDGEWKVNVFADVFGIPTYDAACSGYRYNKKYRMSDCAFDLAKKTQDKAQCDKSECHYVECLKAVGAPAGMSQEAKQCTFCQPYGKTTVDCILDVAIAHENPAVCDTINIESYSDRYCKCWGGYAKYKKNSGYCNMIKEADYSELCVKGYEGGYC